MKYLATAALLLCVGCVSPPRFIEPKLQPMVDDFYHAASEYGMRTPEDVVVIKFNTEIVNDWVGVCKYRFGWREIEIKTGLSYWHTKTILYHELLHCAYFVDHRDDPMDLMDPVPMPAWDDVELRKMLHQVFDRIKKERY